jgi:predicted nucleic acid-binding protein
VPNSLISIPAGETVYVDANIFHFYLRGPDAIRKDCSSLLERVQRGELDAFTSSLALDEVVYKVLLKKIEEKHGKNPLDVIRKSAREIGLESPAVRKAIEIILGIDKLRVLPIERDHIEESVEYMQEYGILPRDAIHFSVMMSAGCRNICSADGDFDRVHEIVRWTPI